MIAVRSARPSCALLAAVACACGSPAERVARVPTPSAPEPFVVDVVEFAPGQGAGFGQDEMPDIVLGPPHGNGTGAQSLHVVSLGRGGTIVVELGVDVVDGAGPDLIVFENPFVIAGGGAGPKDVYAEPGEVSVSADGDAWSTFACDPEAAESVVGGATGGCAGFGIVFASAEQDHAVDATRPQESGGDAFDLADLADAPARVRFVRVVDRGDGPAGGNQTGFDLDAVSVVNAAGAVSPP